MLEKRRTILFKFFKKSGEKVKLEEPNMRLINDEVDLLCHSIRREFERYEDDGILEIENLQKWLDRIEDLAFKIDDYEEETAQEDQDDGFS